MSRTIDRICLALLCVAGSACSREDGSGTAPESPHRYRLERPPGDGSRALTDAEARWRSSLVRNLRRGGQVITFVRTGAELFDRGRPQRGLVFVNSSDPDQFLIHAPHPVIVDFGVREIGTSGTDGITFHPHPAGRAVVALIPTPGVSILGVCLSDESKCGRGRFALPGRSATWDW